MGTLTTLKALWQSNKATSSTPASIVQASEPAFDVATYMAPFEAQLVEDFKQAAIASEQFEQHYGDFTRFLYHPDFDLFLRKKVLLFREPGDTNKDFLDHDHWAKKHLCNFPGPFYAGESDTCDTGPTWAPANVARDAHGCEYIFKQPTSYYELLCVLNTAAIEVFDSYSANGNEYWTYVACKEWWRNRDGLRRYLTREKVIHMNAGQAQRYLDYLTDGAELDLRRYCYFLEQGIYPPNEQTLLPEL
jgi:hypothetical protein